MNRKMHKSQPDNFNPKKMHRIERLDPKLTQAFLGPERPKLKDLGIYRSKHQPTGSPKLTESTGNDPKPNDGSELLDNMRRYDAAFEEYWQSRRRNVV